MGFKGSRQTAALTIASLVAGLVLIEAGVKVKVEHDKTFNFKLVSTWGWNPKSRGEILMARTQNDDPDRARQKAEPLIVEAVNLEMTKLGLRAVEEEPDLTVTYYLMLTTSMSSQTMGEFVPAVPEYGLPPFEPATQSLKVMNRGSLVIDLGAKDKIVWRGMADAKLETDADARKRETVLRDAIRELLKRYPR